MSYPPLGPSPEPYPDTSAQVRAAQQRLAARAARGAARLWPERYAALVSSSESEPVAAPTLCPRCGAYWPNCCEAPPLLEEP